MKGVGAAAAALTLTSYLLVRTERAHYLDVPAVTFVHRPGQTSTDRFVGAMTEVGSVYGIAGITAVLAASGRRRVAGDVAGSGVLAWTTAQAVKPLLRRQRPYQLGALQRLVSEPAGTSWPSGHSAVAAAMATVIGARTRSIPFRLGLLGAVLGIGASRVYVGVHHVTDVLAGFGVGVVSTRVWAAGRRRASRAATASGAANLGDGQRQ